MNPFEKLRKAVDKVKIDYQMPEQLQPSPKNPNQLLITTRSNQPKTPKFQNYQLQHKKQQIAINNTLLDQQVQYIQQINQLSRKNQKLIKSVALLEVEKEQMIQQICVLQKNNEILEQKIKQMAENQNNISDKQRKYKQEIYRINNTIQMLGVELNNERNVKRNTSNEWNKYKDQMEQNLGKYKQKSNEFQEKIKSLQAEIQERTSMLEYNIKKGSEQRKENKLTLERIKSQYDYKLQQLNTFIINVKDELNSYKSNCDILNHKLEAAAQKSNNYQIRQNEMQSDLTGLQQKNRELVEQLRQSIQKIEKLSLDNQQLGKMLKEEKQNVKIKVVQIRDQTLLMELQMYKKQCKELLQQKAILHSLSNERVYEPSYQVIPHRI